LYVFLINNACDKDSVNPSP